MATPGSIAFTSSSSAEGRRRFRDLALIGGHPALDFLNTVKYRGDDEPQDRFETFGDIIAWSRAAGLLSTREAGRLSAQCEAEEMAGRTFAEICGFREDVRLLLPGSQRTKRAHRQAISRVEAAIMSLRPVAKIDAVSAALDRTIVVNCADDLKARMIWVVADALARRPALRIGCCAGADCDWLFVDRTKAGRRKWCDSQTCGNLARVRRFREGI